MNKLARHVKIVFSLVVGGRIGTNYATFFRDIELKTVYNGSVRRLAVKVIRLHTVRTYSYSFVRVRTYHDLV